MRELNAVLAGDDYGSRIRSLAFLLVFAALAAGCADSDDDDVAAPPTVEPAPTTVDTGTETGGIDPLEGASTNPAMGQGNATETALLERISLGRHEGFDRIVFQFRNGLPAYDVAYRNPPFHEDGSGNRVELDGDAFVVVHMVGASGFDVSVPEGELVYTGPRRLKGVDAGTSVIVEAVRTGDFEANLSWVIGLSDRVDFRATELDNPPRLVVDFRNH